GSWPRCCFHVGPGGGFGPESGRPAIIRRRWEPTEAAGGRFGEIPRTRTARSGIGAITRPRRRPSGAGRKRPRRRSPAFSPSSRRSTTASPTGRAAGGPIALHLYLKRGLTPALREL